MSESIAQIECRFQSGNELYMAYMPYVSEGGLFIRTAQQLDLSTQVILKISLLNEDEVYSIEAKVIWYTPKGAQANRPHGIGFQFVGDNSWGLRNKIETYLASMQPSNQSTDTL